MDQDEEGKGFPFVAIGVLKVSSNHRFLAFTLDTSGEEKYRIVIKDLETERVLTVLLI